MILSSIFIAATIAIVLAWSAAPAFPASSCKEALSALAVCTAANDVAVRAMAKRHLEATLVMQNVATGTLAVFAASESAVLDVATPVLPLSLSKLFLAASWWDNRLREAAADSVHEMLVEGRDSLGRQLALELRQSAGTGKVMADLRRYGFNGGNERFWAEVDGQWRQRLTPPPAEARIDQLNDQDWSQALSIGEQHMKTTALQISQFLQAVGNHGTRCAPVARRVNGSGLAEGCRAPARIMEEPTARQLMAAMLDTVKRGTAKGIATALDGTGWSMGGKTGTGGVAGAPLERQDGWFAGLVFDRQGEARYTVATFVRRGGTGGGNAAAISAEVARFVISEGLPAELRAH
jgi:cell division protein FtsI/penicillin-binding protein 2